MKIYSIKEIVNATNYFLKPGVEQKILNKENKKIKIPPETENIILKAEKSILEKEKNYLNNEKPLLLNDEVSNLTDNKINSFNFKIKIKPAVKDLMINELYFYLQKKVKKNTLKLIIDEQLEIKNLKNKINLLKTIESELKNNYHILMNDYEFTKNNNINLETNIQKLSDENKELNTNNNALLNNLNEVKENKIILVNENKELKINSSELQNNLNQISAHKEILDKENKNLKNDLKETKLNLEESLVNNKSYEINNFELKNTVSRYINNTKKIQEKLDVAEGSKNLKLDQHSDKVKFYQDENIRLSAELLSVQQKNETIKENLDFIETEKEKISNKIKELSNSVNVKTNILPTPFTKEEPQKPKEDLGTLNDKEQKSLDDVISKIFQKSKLL